MDGPELHLASFCGRDVCQRCPGIWRPGLPSQRALIQPRCNARRHQLKSCTGRKLAINLETPGSVERLTASAFGLALRTSPACKDIPRSSSGKTASQPVFGATASAGVVLPSLTHRSGHRGQCSMCEIKSEIHQEAYCHHLRWSIRTSKRLIRHNSKRS